MSFSIVIPTLGRSGKLHPLVENIRQTADVPLLFVTDPADKLTHEALRKLDVGVLEVVGGYPKAANAGFRATDSAWVLIANDDVVFHSGWYEAAKPLLAKSVGVVGTNDLHNEDVLAGNYATQPIVSRAYVEQYGTIDEPGKVYHEGYHHNWCDVELCETAQFRGMYAHAHEAKIEHIHPDHGLREHDATDEVGELLSRAEDRALFEHRRPKWSKS